MAYKCYIPLIELSRIEYGIYKYREVQRSDKETCPSDSLTAVHLAVACGVFYGVFCAVLFPAGCLGWDLGLN